jgi:DNA topoisomerase-6 subunit B
MKIARSLQKYIRAKKAAKEEAMRSKIFENLVPVIIREAAVLAETEVPEYESVLAKVSRRAKFEKMELEKELENEVQNE